MCFKRCYWFVTLLSFLYSAVAWKAMDPEQVLFGLSRCGEDFTPDDKNRELRIKTYANWSFQPRDNWTYCYVSCCLEKIQILDVTTLKFKTNGIRGQYEEYKQYHDVKQTEVNSFESALQQLNKLKSPSDCNNVFSTFMNDLRPHWRVLATIYHMNPVITKRIYDSKKSMIRQKKQAYPEYCENRIFAKQHSALCNFRKAGKSNHEDYPKLIECIFGGYRYMDEQGQINIQEIIRDFHAINVINQDTNIRNVITRCKQGQAKVAVDYYECLLDDKEIGKLFKDAYDYREVRSADYDYAFRIPGPPKYDCLEVMRNVNTVNARNCQAKID